MSCVGGGLVLTWRACFKRPLLRRTERYFFFFLIDTLRLIHRHSGAKKETILLKLAVAILAAFITAFWL